MDTRYAPWLHATALAAIVLLVTFLPHPARAGQPPAEATQLHRARLPAPAAVRDARDPGVPLRRVRSTNSRIRLAFAEGLAKAPTFRALVRELEASDVMIYVEAGDCQCRGVLACLTLVTRAGSMRLLRATVSLEQNQMDAVAAVGHELHHALEIARAPEVVDVPTMRSFYEARAESRNRAACSYETADARRAQLAVRSELARWKADTQP